jgi:hypothetical protein
MIIFFVRMSITKPSRMNDMYVVEKGKEGKYQTLRNSFAVKTSNKKDPFV